MKTLLETPRLVHKALATLARIVDSDIAATTIDIDLFENLNTNQALNYLSLHQSLESLSATTASLCDLSTDLKTFNAVLDNIEEKVLVLEAVCSELDSWEQDLAAQIASKQ